MWKDLPWSPMKRCTVGYGKTNARKVLCTSTFVEKGKKYNKRGNSLAGRGYIPNRVDIEERSAIVDLKKRFGDLEIDIVIGSNHKGALVTINDWLTSKVGSASFREGCRPVGIKDH